LPIAEDYNGNLIIKVTMAPESPVVRVGVAAVIKNAEGKMVMGIRKGLFGGM